MVALKIASKNFELESKGIINNANIENDLMDVEQLFDKYL